MLGQILSCVRFIQSSLSYADLQWKVINVLGSFPGILLENSGSGASLQVKIQFHYQLRGYFGQVTQSLCPKFFVSPHASLNPINMTK